MENQPPQNNQPYPPPPSNPYIPPAGPYAPPQSPVQASYPTQPPVAGPYPPAPAVPNPAPAPQAYGYPGGVPPHAASGNKRKFIVLGAIVGGLIALVGGGAFAYSSLMSVSAEDYKLATQASTDLETKLRDVDFKATSTNSLYSDSTSEAQAEITKAKAAIADYEKAVTEFTSQKALRDNEMSDLHKKFEAKNNAYLKSVKAFSGDLEKALPALTRCQSDSGSRSNVTAIVKQLEDCASGLNAVTGLQDPNIKLVVDATKELAQNGSNTLKKYQQATADKRYSEASKLYSAYYDTQDAALDKAEKADDDLRMTFENSYPSKELQALTNKLSSKSFAN